MSTCTSIDPLVTSYIDGESSAAERSLVDEHLLRCPRCHTRVAAEGTVRELVRARNAALTSERASAGLRAQCGGLAVRSADRSRPASDPSANPPAARAFGRAPGRGPLAPLALAASLVLLVGGAFVYEATDRSARVMAAELAADHVKCFAENGILGTHDAPAAVESSMVSGFGWHLHLPEQLNAIGFELVGARRCLYAQGKVAHIMYRQQGRPVSIFMLPNSARPEELVEVLGHEAAIWSVGDRTFVLVTRGTRAEVQRMAALVKGALQ